MALWLWVWHDIAMTASDLPLAGQSAAPNVYPRRADAFARRLHVLVAQATGASRAQVAMADSGDIAAAVGAARAAFDAGRAPDRRAVLDRLIAGISARHEDFAAAISREMGAPVDFARAKQVDAALSHLRVIRAAMDQESAVDPQAAHAVRYEPLGVAALITPWNWPLNQAALKLGAALAAGCTMVWKPSEMAPESAALLGEVAFDAGAGDGVVLVLQGDGAVGAELVGASGVDVVSFTGSTAAGRKVATTAGAHLRPVLLELGGKSANILFDDCDLPLAVQQGMAHCVRNSGQSCNAATRMLVQDTIYDQVVALAMAEAQGYAIAPADQPGNHLGPLVSQVQFDRVQRCIAEAIEDGARLIGGGPGAGPAGPMSPRVTVFADVTPEMRLFHDEVFGPVLAISRFSTEGQAIALANDSDYGLAGYIQTADRDRAARVATALQVGMVQINGTSRAPGAPFGGRKASGFGREAGLWGIRAFQTVKSISGL